MSKKWTYDDLYNKQVKGTIPIQQVDLFSSKLSAQSIVRISKPVNKDIDDEGMRTLEFFIPAMKDKEFKILDPIPKQSVRFVVTRYNKAGHHTDVFTGANQSHQKGDVVIYKNKNTGRRDVITQTYQKAIIGQWEKHIANYVSSQLPADFVMFTQKVHILKQYYIFQPLKSFTKTKIRAIEEDELIEKGTKPDLDNLTKAIWDSIEGLVFKNDALISSIGSMGKYYGKTPGVILIIKGK